jgi:voltage-dependent potassium channel beta subunit
MEMPHRRLGASGLKVSVLSFGAWMSFGTQLDQDAALECMQAAHDGGMNFFDNAESYAGGEAERMMGTAIAELGWPRWSYVISTKLFAGIHDDVNMRKTLNRKYLLQAIDGSLERLGLDFVDLLFCHRRDRDTPIEETVWAMSDIVASGKALYWGTSGWSARDIRAAWEFADRRGLRTPVMEQAQYNVFERRRVEREYARLYDAIGLGLTTWSPLASGVLTGKYLDGVPESSRAALPGSERLRASIDQPATNERVRRLRDIAEDLGCSTAQLAIAWCAANSRVSTVITGASRVEQVRENLGALDVLQRLDKQTLARIRAATQDGRHERSARVRTLARRARGKLRALAPRR